MKKIQSIDATFSTEIKNSVFFAAYFRDKSCEGFYFQEHEITDGSWVKHIPQSTFTCKVIGPKKFEEKIISCLTIHKAKIEKYVCRESGTIHFNPSDGKLFIEKTTPATPFAEMKRKLRVMIVDDSKTIRQILRKIISSDASMEVVADFENPREALSQVEKIKPDLITLDIHMPELDGIQFLKHLMPKNPTPVLMISSISMEEGPLVFNALEAGAVDYIQKPTFEQISEASPQIIDKIKMAISAKLQSTTAQNTILPIHSFSYQLDMSKIIAIGSSTGGTEALRELLIRLPANIPPILIVQHIPAVFSKAFADRMNGLCRFKVTEAKDGEQIEENHCYIAPGGFQMSIKKNSSSNFSISIQDSDPVNRHKPSVDVLFHSIAKLCGKKAIGIILTGMGADGANGLLEMKKNGAMTFGQNEESCIVYGMPQAAKKLGAVDLELHLFKLPEAMLNALTLKRKAS